MRLLILGIFFSLTGCATYTKTVMPSGEAGLSISCDGSLVGMNVCYEKAGELCPYGYTIHNKEDSGGWLATNSFAGSTSLKGLLVSCRQPSKAPASVDP